MKRAFVIGIVGAESSGKTQLAQALQVQLSAEGRLATFVSEALRDFCDRHRRTPREDEQAPLAAEQTRRIDTAAADSDKVVIADTTALMIAVYSELVFGDTSLYAMAEATHRRCDLTLLTALDLPWQADGLQRDGEHVREPVDALVRAALQRIGQPFVVVTGRGDARLQSAWRAVQRALELPRAEKVEDAGNAHWHGRCERCGDAACERHLLLPQLPTLSRRP
jgi:nicotinamide riboside kinase